MSGSGRPAEASSGDLDRRVLAWVTAPEGVSASRVLDATLANLPRIRQEPWRPWTPVLDALSRPASLELPRWAWVLLVLLLLLAVSLATMTVASRIRQVIDPLSALPADPATMADVPCPGEFVAGGDVRCRVATIPERHERGAGPEVRVLIAEFRAGDVLSAAPGAAPVLVPITLDPNGERTIVDLAALARAIERPVIGVMPRGTGLSDPSLACPELESVETPPASASLDDPTWRESLAAAVRSCRDRLTADGIDVEAYGLAQQAADLESIGKGLGVDRWLVRTDGDDSRLALELIRWYPDRVAGVVMTRPAFPGDDPAAVTDDGIRSSIANLASLCAADAFCSARYRAPDDAFSAAMRAPGAGLVARAIRSTLSTSGSVAAAPSRLDRIAGGDLAWPNAQLAARGWCLGWQLGCSTGSGWTGGGEFSAVCLSRSPASTPASLSGSAAAGVSELLATDPWNVICDAWVGDRRDESTTRSVTSHVPVVAIAAALDPFHSLASITAGMQGLSQGRVVTLPWAPEGAGVRCLDGGAAWLGDPSAELPAACTQVALPQFADAP